MKISNGSILEMILAIFFLSVGFNIEDSFTSFIVILVSIIVIIHILYIFFNNHKNKFSNCKNNNLAEESSNNGFIKFFSIISLILIILLVGVSSIQDNTNNKKKSEKEKEKEDDIELTTQVQEPCSYYPIDGNYNIIISAESSSGVGDVFSKMDSNLEYRIHDNNYGDTYISERKYQGDQTRYECDEIWYEIYLQNGKHGFIWAGRDGMYAKEQ